MNPYHAPCSDEESAEGDLRFCSNQDKEKELNIQVILRCRPLNEEEKCFCMPAVVFCNELKGEVLTIQNVGNKLIDRTYVFDKVFGPSSNQMELFIQSISPIISEVLEGFNCTIVAYGQSGTGKTYTMDGGWKKTKNGETDSGAGVIPRSVQQIFEEFEDKYPEYSMKVSYIEIYNEEIMDLLADDDWEFSEDTLKIPIVLMEDGKGGVDVRGMKEMIVYSADEIYSILDRGRTRRHTAEALLNKQSSCSHSIFSITVHIRQFTQEGEEVIKTGKLNLVDLAGSRNLLRSGAQEVGKVFVLQLL